MRDRYPFLHRLKIFLIGISVLMLAAYLFMVVPHAFAGWEDFAVLLAVHILIFLSSRYIISPWLFKRSRLRLKRLLLGYTGQVVLLVGILVMLSLVTGALRWQDDRWNIANLWETLLVFVFPNVLGFLFFLMKRGLAVIEEYRSLAHRQEQEISAIGFQFGQQQMFPHFLFNTLAAIRYFSRHDPRKSTTAMSLLIDMSKFYLETPNRIFVPLLAELEQVQHLVAIYSLRLAQRLYMDIRAERMEDAQIPAMLLVNLVENACQYGVLTDPKSPACVDVSLSENGQCVIYVRNTIRKRKLAGTVHGHANLQKMRENLRLLDPNENDLLYSEEDGVFTVTVLFKQCKCVRSG